MREARLPRLGRQGDVDHPERERDEGGLQAFRGGDLGRAGGGDPQPGQPLQHVVGAVGGLLGEDVVGGSERGHGVPPVCTNELQAIC